MKKCLLVAGLLLVLLPLWGGISLSSDCTADPCAASVHTGPCLEGTPVFREMPQAGDYFIFFNPSFQRRPLPIALDIFVPPS